MKHRLNQNLLQEAFYISKIAGDRFY